MATDTAHPVSTQNKPKTNRRLGFGALLLVKGATEFPQDDLLQLANPLAPDQSGSVPGGELLLLFQKSLLIGLRSFPPTPRTNLTRRSPLDRRLHET
jgi:hypothetical protein